MTASDKYLPILHRPGMYTGAQGNRSDNEWRADALAAVFDDWASFKAPTRQEFIYRLRASLAYCDAADDTGSIDHEMARWQEWVRTWPQIADENGGI